MATLVSPPAQAASCPVSGFAQEDWDEFGDAHAGGGPIGIMSTAWKMAFNQKLMAPIESLWEGIMPVWPPWGRALTWGSYYGAGGDSMSAPGGWRHVDADGKALVPADVFMVTNRVVANVGFEAYFEQWAAAEGASRVRFAQHTKTPNVEIMGSSLEKFEWVKTGDKWIKRLKAEGSDQEGSEPTPSGGASDAKRTPPPWVTGLGLGGEKEEAPEPEVFDLDAMMSDMEESEPGGAGGVEEDDDPWKRRLGGADDMSKGAAMGDALVEAKEDHGFRGYLMLRRPGSPDEDPPGATYTSFSVWKDKASYKEFLEWEPLDRVDHPRNPQFEAAEEAGAKTYYEGIFTIDVTVQHTPPYPGMTGVVPGCERRRRLTHEAGVAQGSSAAHDGRRVLACPSGVCESEQAWWEEWAQRLDCWWIGTPHKASMHACFGALGLHLARRFEQLVQFRGNAPNTPIPRPRYRLPDTAPPKSTPPTPPPKKPQPRCHSPKTSPPIPHPQYPTLVPQPQ